MAELSEVCELNPKKSEIDIEDSNTLVSFIPMADINENEMYLMPKEGRPLKNVFNGYTYFRDGDVLLAKVTPCFENGKAGIAQNLLNGIGFGSSEYYIFRCSSKVLPIWIYLQLTSNYFRKEGERNMTGTGGLQRIPKDFVLKYQIPVPSIHIQLEITKAIEKEQNLIASNKELITLYELKIKAEIAKLWQEDESATSKKIEALVSNDPF